MTLNGSQQQDKQKQAPSPFIQSIRECSTISNLYQKKKLAIK